MKKGQTATEYLIILAVVIIIALIVVGVLGGIPGMGGGAGSRTSASYWATADVAFTSYSISATGSDTLVVRNNLRDGITVTSILLNGTALYGTDFQLAPGTSTTITSDLINCTAGQSFSYSVQINYTNSVTSASYTFTGDGTNLEGTCAA
ncbi:class III signal peptide-containing protein [Candidatus Woesearchaeota archaeon]|nr:MAG: class III signal peptide-containing protein [Candidatus Woesearchaeota archaeon]